MRNVFIDCGANLGLALKKFIEELPGYEIFAFEPNPALQPYISEHIKDLASPSLLHVSRDAVWIEDGNTNLYLGHHESSTVMLGKRIPPHYGPPIDYSKPLVVSCIDFSSWVMRTFSPEDNIVVKMDIEGAEYPVLKKMLADNSLSYIKTLYVEWHYDRFAYMSDGEHSELVEAVSRVVQVKPWN